MPSLNAASQQSEFNAVLKALRWFPNSAEPQAVELADASRMCIAAAPEIAHQSHNCCNKTHLRCTIQRYYPCCEGQNRDSSCEHQDFWLLCALAFVSCSMFGLNSATILSHTASAPNGAPDGPIGVPNHIWDESNAELHNKPLSAGNGPFCETHSQG